MAKSTSESKKKRFAAAKTEQRHIKKKAHDFEADIKEKISQAAKSKIRIVVPRVEGKVKWTKETTNKWSFGPFKIVPEWMKPIIEKYKTFYKTEHKVKKAAYVKKEDKNIEEQENISLHAQSAKMRKRTGISDTKKK